MKALSSLRRNAAAAIGSTVASVTSPPSRNGSLAVADGTNSRSATSSHSAAKPSKGLVTITLAAPPAAPWQAL